MQYLYVRPLLLSLFWHTFHRQLMHVPKSEWSSPFRKCKIQTSTCNGICVFACCCKHRKYLHFPHAVTHLAPPTHTHTHANAYIPTTISTICYQTTGPPLFIQRSCCDPHLEHRLLHKRRDSQFVLPLSTANNSDPPPTHICSATATNDRSIDRAQITLYIYICMCVCCCAINSVRRTALAGQTMPSTVCISISHAPLLLVVGCCSNYVCVYFVAIITSYWSQMSRGCWTVSVSCHAFDCNYMAFSLMTALAFWVNCSTYHATSRTTTKPTARYRLAA